MPLAQVDQWPTSYSFTGTVPG